MRTLPLEQGRAGSLWHIVLFVFVDVLGFSLMLPLLPYHADQLGASATAVGAIISVNALGQAIMAPLLGRWSDVHGRKPILLACVIATTVSFIVVGFSSSVPMLFLGRALDGVFGGNIALAQAYIVDVARYGGSDTSRKRGDDNDDDSSTVRGMGFIGAAFGIGFIVGPVAGGVLGSTFGYHVPAFVAAALAFANCVGIAFGLPESLPVQHRAAPDAGAATWPVASVIASLCRPVLGPLLALRFVHMFVFTAFETTFGLFCSRQLGLEARQGGYLLAVVALAYAVVQAGAMKRLVRRWGGLRLIGSAFVLTSFSLAVWACTASASWLLVAALVPFGMASGVLNTAINALITSHASAHEVGHVLGVSAAVGSATRILAPLTSGYIIEAMGAPAAPLSSAALALLAALVSPLLRVAQPNPLQEEPDTSHEASSRLSPDASHDKTE